MKYTSRTQTISGSETQVAKILKQTFRAKFLMLLLQVTLILIAIFIASKDFKYSKYIIYIVIIIFSFMIFESILSYLQGKNEKENLSITDRDEFIRTIYKYIDETVLKSEGIDANEQIASKMDNLTTDHIFELIDKKYQQKDYVDFYEKSISKDIGSSNTRLQHQISQINRSANVNLAVGVITSIVAITILSSAYFDSKSTPITEFKQLYNFIPRIFLSVFIEMFSFFFLQLYKRNLEDIKYLYNERTNFEMKLIALKTSLFKAESTTLKSVIEELVKTERNFILKKDETTFDILRNKAENENNIQLIEKIAAIFKNR